MGARSSLVLQALAARAGSASLPSGAPRTPIPPLKHDAGPGVRRSMAIASEVALPRAGRVGEKAGVPARRRKAADQAPASAPVCGTTPRLRRRPPPTPPHPTHRAHTHLEQRRHLRKLAHAPARARKLLLQRRGLAGGRRRNRVEGLAVAGRLSGDDAARLLLDLHQARAIHLSGRVWCIVRVPGHGVWWRCCSRTARSKRERRAHVPRVQAGRRWWCPREPWWRFAGHTNNADAKQWVASRLTSSYSAHCLDSS